MKLNIWTKFCNSRLWTSRPFIWYFPSCCISFYGNVHVAMQVYNPLFFFCPALLWLWLAIPSLAGLLRLLHREWDWLGCGWSWMYQSTKHVKYRHGRIMLHISNAVDDITNDSGEAIHTVKKWSAKHFDSAFSVLKVKDIVDWFLWVLD